MYNVLADTIVVIHFLFIVFVLFGGCLVIFRPWTAILHLPAAIWGAFVELSGWICPLTPLENRLRDLAGEHSYTGDFIVQYLMPVIYPEKLTTSIQQFLGMAVIFINLIFYYIAIKRHTKKA
jgi:hypothetical protein